MCLQFEAYLPLHLIMPPNFDSATEFDRAITVDFGSSTVYYATTAYYATEFDYAAKFDYATVFDCRVQMDQCVRILLAAGSTASDLQHNLKNWASWHHHITERSIIRNIISFLTVQVPSYKVKPWQKFVIACD